MTKTLDRTLRHQTTNLGSSLSSSSSKICSRPLALRVLSKTKSWKIGVRIIKKIKLRMAPSRMVDMMETNHDIQWGQFHSKNLSTKAGNKNLREIPIEKALNTSVNTIGLKVTNHNCCMSMLILLSRRLGWSHLPWDE